jgi:hypothetical protein
MRRGYVDHTDGQIPQLSRFVKLPPERYPQVVDLTIDLSEGLQVLSDSSLEPCRLPRQSGKHRADDSIGTNTREFRLVIVVPVMVDVLLLGQFLHSLIRVRSRPRLAPD